MVSEGGAQRDAIAIGTGHAGRRGCDHLVDFSGRAHGAGWRDDGRRARPPGTKGHWKALDTIHIKEDSFSAHGGGGQAH